jgi:hypothetical protein
MKNSECTIYITTNDGKIYQSYRKNKKGWTQTVISNGNVRAITAEQLLSHILPPLAFGNVTVKVVPDEGIEIRGINQSNQHP